MLRSNSLEGTRESHIVVCIPAFNEENSIAKVILATKKFADSIIVCDDGSTDMTAEIAEALEVKVIRLGVNKGKGLALKRLAEQARVLSPRVVVTLDADGQHDPADIPRVVAPVLEGEADIVIGARPLKNEVMPRNRVIGNKLLDEITSRKAGLKITDTQSGFRAYSPQALEVIEFAVPGMAIESQTLIDAAKAGLRIKEVSIATTYTGVRQKRSALKQFSGIMDYVLSRTIADSPLLYLGIPGAAIIVAGLGLGLNVVGIFEQYHSLALGTALIAVSSVTLGTIMLSTALIIKLLKTGLRS